MPVNGYWIECVPITKHIGEDESVNLTASGLYNARLATLPDVNVMASSPDQAINRLRQKLRALSRYYRIKGQDLPAMDNPVQPPRTVDAMRGWISVYVQVENICNP
ncbi:MAG: hypothetical protein AAB276_03080 [Pseudomonadota bacterium]